MYKYPCAVIVLILVSFAPQTMSPAEAAEEGDRIADPYKPSVVQITTLLEGGQKSGFGFVVGKKKDLLYIITANHVVRSEHSDSTTPQIHLRFYEDASGPPIDAELLQVTHRRLDLALLRAPIPRRFNINWGNIHHCTQFTRGEKAWFIGREQDWFVPTDNEAGSIHGDEPDIDGYINFGIYSVKPGTSGAPLITRRGIIGMITQDAVSDSRAVAVQFIRKFVEENRLPWDFPSCEDRREPDQQQEPARSREPDRLQEPKTGSSTTIAVVKLAGVSSTPGVIRAGNDVRLTLNYDVFTPAGAEVPVTGTWTVYKDGVEQASIPAGDVEQRGSGGYVKSGLIPIPEGMDLGTYVVEHRIESGTSSDVAESSFVIVR